VSGASLFVLVGLFAVLWFVLIRPQKARQRAQQQQLESVAPGDEVLTVGGLYGIVQSIDEEGDLIVEIAEGIHVRLARRSVATVVKAEDDEDDDDEYEDEDEDEGEDENEEEGEDEDGEDEGEDAHDEAKSPVSELQSAATPVPVPDDEATPEATQRRLFRRRN
jgi:preprotein translocase subunit YajC